MRIIDVEQGSENWERWRARPTASQFGRIISPVRGDYSSSSTAYACEIVAKRNRFTTIEDVPVPWMDYGSENEPNAVHAYEQQFGMKTSVAGFVLPDGTDAYGGSPDRLVGVYKDGDRDRASGVLECKCVKPETLMMMHLDPPKAENYAKPQVQGLLLITGCLWCDLYVWHPDLEPFWMRMEPDVEYQEKLAACLLKFLDEIEHVAQSIKTKRHQIVANVANKSEVRW